MYRQGDLLIVKINDLPQGLEIKDNILAYEEATGHKHQLVGQVQLFRDKIDNQYFEVKEISRLVHEEHADVELISGFFKVIRQREYDMTDSISFVMD